MSAARSPASRAAGWARARSISPGAPFITAASQSAAAAHHKPAHFATTSIATKPEKPCDGGVFRALNSLPKREQNTRIRAAPGLRFVPAARICAASGHERRPQPRFTRRWLGKGAQHFTRRAFHHGGQSKRGSRPPQASVFRYHFDSSKARKTVRWGRFRPPEFAPEKRVERPHQGRWLASALAAFSPQPAGRAANAARPARAGKTVIAPLASRLAFLHKPFQRLVMNPFCSRQHSERHRLFRYWFDSSEARKTVRWGRFRGLEFAPEKRAKHAYQGRARLAFCARCPDLCGFRA